MMPKEDSVICEYKDNRYRYSKRKKIPNDSQMLPYALIHLHYDQFPRLKNVPLTVRNIN
jgi:hypothetical protein